MRCVFVGTPGFLGRIDSDTRCAFWTREPVDHGFDPGQLIAVDLARTPSAAAAKEIGWDEVEVDDCFAGPNGTLCGTTLGPRWPELSLSGAVYLEESFAARVGLPCPPEGMDCHDYECMTVAYHPGTADGRAGNRYTGHHAEILDERGSLAKVAVWAPGRSREPHTRPVVMWLDLDSPEQCDAGPDSLTTLRTGPAGCRTGALFLISGTLSTEEES
ncbi:hypothetical protein [Virgisporangium aliadipatigenens]|uniref:hypothetical protein n=1 Tax=Virgisporangium aliadipatigenens TaxID=741659 RepID=UPI001943F69F|nr:hypothetical protein [Virgisporangium aliadipatigenens]